MRELAKQDKIIQDEQGYLPESNACSRTQERGHMERKQRVKFPSTRVQKNRDNQHNHRAPHRSLELNKEKTVPGNDKKRK